MKGGLGEGGGGEGGAVGGGWFWIQRAKNNVQKYIYSSFCCLKMLIFVNNLVLMGVRTKVFSQTF